MRQESIYNILHIRLYLVITTILIFMFMGLHLANAQEPDDIPPGAILISPNGPSQIHSFSFPGDIDWFKFKAEKGITYQIFTRPKNPGYPYNLTDTVIYLFSDPAKDHIAYNDDFKEDRSSLINWSCLDSGVYFIRVQAYDFGRYIKNELYSIQITSIDYQNSHTIIQDVPDYSQSDFGASGNCGPIAAACVLGYWDAQGYNLLVDSHSGLIEDVIGLVNELQEAIEDSEKKYSLEQGDVHLCEGIRRVCNDSEYENNYDFKVDLFPGRNFFFKVIDEITEDRPVLHGVTGHSIWGNHWMVTIGYLKTDTTQWTINHDTWSDTHRDIYVDWDEATDCIITINPSTTNPITIIPAPLTPPNKLEIMPPIPYFNPQLFSFPSFNPLTGSFPSFGFGTSSFYGMTPMPFTLLSSPLSTGYSTQFNLGVSGYRGSSSNLEGPDNQRSMAGNIYSQPFSPYGYNYNTTAYEINQNPTQETYFGSSLSPYSSMNLPSYSSAGLFNNPFFFTPQMLIPASGLLTYPMLSPFYSLSPGLPLFGFPF